MNPVFLFICISKTLICMPVPENVHSQHPAVFNSAAECAAITAKLPVESGYEIRCQTALRETP